MIRKMSNPAMAEDKSAGIQQLEDIPLPVAACPLSPDQPCKIISVAAENKSLKSIHNVQCKAWKFLYVAHCTTVSQPAFEIYLSEMLNMNRPKNITYMAVMYDIRQMPRKSNQANVTIEGFLQGRLYASTLKKWLDFEWSPVWGGLCRDPEFHDFFFLWRITVNYERERKKCHIQLSNVDHRSTCTVFQNSTNVRFI